ncbi:MAG: TetR/AcrR family transcriptional regulator [Chloroflexota bacterium]
MAKSIAEKRQHFIDASTAFLAQKHNASLNEIADHIGVGRATLQRYFPKRQDLLREIALECVQKVDQVLKPIQTIEQSAEAGLRMFFDVLVPLGDAYHFLATYPDVISFEEVAKDYGRQLNTLHRYVEYLKRENVIAIDIPDAWAVRMIDLLIWGAWSAVHAGSIARNDAAELAFRSLVSGLGQQVVQEASF